MLHGKLWSFHAVQGQHPLPDWSPFLSAQAMHTVLLMYPIIQLDMAKRMDRENTDGTLELNVSVKMTSLRLF